MKTVVCIGGGRFGSKAATKARSLGARVLVIDRDANCPAKDLADSVVDDPGALRYAGEGEVLFHKGDGASTLREILTCWVPDMVVPASSGHLAAHLAVEHFRHEGRELRPTSNPLPKVIEALPPRSILLVDEKMGILVTSFMRSGHVCLEDCEQPPVCPITKTLIPTPMDQCIIRALEMSVDDWIVLTTREIGGVGGVLGSDLKSMLSIIDRLETNTTCGIATACRCHGVINLFMALS